MSTLKEPYRIEGKKTMGYELAEQLDWKLPDVIIYPTGGGTGRTEGIFACPEGGATLAAFNRLRIDGWISDGETVVLFNTGSGHKYSHLWK
jgi:threonine synthase